MSDNHEPHITPPLRTLPVRADRGRTMTSPHRIGQTTKAEIAVAHLLDTAPAGADHQHQAAVIVQQLQAIGWAPPPDPSADRPPLVGRGADPDHRKACMADIRAALTRSKP